MHYNSPSPRYEAHRRSFDGTTKKRNSKSFFSKGFFLLSLFVLLSGVFFFFSVRSVGDTLVMPGTYTLERGVTLSRLPESLDISVPPQRYKLWIKFFAPSVNLLAGSYKITETHTLERVFQEILQKPAYTDLTITVLPGWNIYDIDSSLSEKNIIKAGDFILSARDHFSDLREKYPFLRDRTSLEGFLYPDTYRIAQDSDAYIIIDRLLSEWQKKIYPTYEKLGNDAYREAILSSIVEREERVRSEQPIVADILSKRVREGIPMGADATVCYEYAKTQKQCTPTFIASVITEKTSYNTRNKQGYPPTPISSFSLATWEAVMTKKPSEYYYYLHDSSGQIHYGRTLTEHNANKAKYLY